MTVTNQQNQQSEVAKQERKVWVPMKLSYAGSVKDIAMPGILKTGTIVDPAFPAENKPLLSG